MDQGQRQKKPSSALAPPLAAGSAERAASAATTQMAALLATQRILDTDGQRALVDKSLPALQAPVVAPLAQATTEAAKVRTAPGPAFSSSAFTALLDKGTDSTAHENSSVQMLFDGANSFAERERLINGATSSICLETFIFADDDTGRHTADLLIAAVQRGVQVSVIYDDMGSQSTPDALFDRMRKGGVQVRGYGSLLTQAVNINHRSHVKSFIVDGTSAIMGGMNIADDYAYGGTSMSLSSRGDGHKEGWRDADVEITGAAVADVQSHFAADWALLGAALPPAKIPPPQATAQAASGSAVRVIEHRPNEQGDNNTMNAYVAAIEASEHHIDIENAYFIPPAPIREALVAAAKRGVVVRVRTNSFSSSDNFMDVGAAHYFYPELIAAGIQIYEQGTQMLHAKTATFDGTFSLVGSVNLNGRSDGRDAENLLAISDPKTSSALEQRFSSRFEDTKPITAADMMAEGTWLQLEEWSLSQVAWTL